MSKEQEAVAAPADQSFRISVKDQSYVRLRTNDPDVVARVAKALGKGAVVRAKGEDGKFHALA